jgi:5S rRNA maturation endonuclease (ribonuclease M5)
MKRRELKSCQKVLIVEGYGDLTFYAEFLERLGKYDAVFIQDMGGREKLMAELTTFITPALLANKTHVAVILDSDDDGPAFSDRLKARLDILTKRSLAEGEWTDGGPDAKVGFWLAPHPNEVGEIEDLVWRTFTEDPARADEVRCVEEFITCMKAGPSATNARIAKRRLGSWLAVRHEDDPRLGPAARDGKINFDAPALSRLKAFLQGF